MSFSEYLQVEDRNPVKHEYLDGVAFAMAGGTAEHARLSASVARVLGNRMAGKPCGVFSSDLRIHAKASGLATYADVTVICGKSEFDPEDRKQTTVINPILLVEVLSPSTEAYDRGEKLAHYKGIASLKVVLLVSQETRTIEAWHRTSNGWENAVHRDGAVPLPELGCELPLDEVYANPQPG